jgi:hypothetical protein
VNIVDVPLPVNFVREIENLPLPPEAYQCPQCRLDHGALGLEPGSFEGFLHKLIADLDVGAHLPLVVYTGDFNTPNTRHARLQGIPRPNGTGRDRSGLFRRNVPALIG